MIYTSRYRSIHEQTAFSFRKSVQLLSHIRIDGAAVKQKGSWLDSPREIKPDYCSFQLSDFKQDV